MTDTSAFDNFFLSKEEPHRSCLLFLRNCILETSPNITEHWKYGLPFYYYRKKMFCYLWQHKKLKMPYIGFVDGDKLHHKFLLQEKRARMKILPVDPAKDIPVKVIRKILADALKWADKRLPPSKESNRRSRSGTQNNV